MPREAELLDPLVRWLCVRFGQNELLLLHEEPQGRGGRRPDILAVTAEPGRTSVDDALLVPVEIERSSRAAVRDPKNGLRQLRRYPGHASYLAIPQTVHVRWEARKIPRACERSGVGLLVVDLAANEVEEVVEPHWGAASHGLRYYPKSMERYVALRNSSDSYRRISRGRISERG